MVVGQGHTITRPMVAVIETATPQLCFLVGSLVARLCKYGTGYGTATAGFLHQNKTLSLGA